MSHVNGGVRLRVGIAAVALIAAAACGGGGDKLATSGPTIGITSPSFSEGSAIPSRYTCDGEDLSPPLSWSGIPQGTRSLALIADDPDAPGGTWVHWVLYAVAPDVTEIEEGSAGAVSTAIGAIDGTNDFRRLGYGGPCPPPGGPHRYLFKLFALDSEPELNEGATKKDLVRAMEGHVLAEGRLMGTYRRR